MRKILFSTFFVLLACASFAQAPVAKGKAQINLGVGFSNWGVPVYGGFDVGVHPDITLGGEVSYRKYKEYWKWGGKKGYYYSGDASIWGFSFNGNYHLNKILNIPKEWNLYAGLNVGYVSWSYRDGLNNGYSNNSGLGLGAQIGGRYFFSEKFGLNLEAGGGNKFSSGKFGVTIKL
ncbi:MAG: hypothetical protein EAZ95_00165 [Bacteroidetes bacterium]|nr:MAG: hypothetical protein EAZ95_00165 [Bacteroidota bacterium]